MGRRRRSTRKLTKPGIFSGPGDDVHWAWLRHGGATDVMLNTAYDDGERPPGSDAPRQAAHADTCLFGRTRSDRSWLRTLKVGALTGVRLEATARPHR